MNQTDTEIKAMIDAHQEASYNLGWVHGAGCTAAVCLVTLALLALYAEPSLRGWFK